MLYCTKCHGACQDSAAKCPNCKNSKLRPLEGEDMVRLHRADQYTAGLLEQRFAQEGVGFQMEPFSGGWVSYLYDNDVLPTDKLVLVRWSDYDRAKELSSQVRRQVVRSAPPWARRRKGRPLRTCPAKSAFWCRWFPCWRLFC